MGRENWKKAKEGLLQAIEGVRTEFSGQLDQACRDARKLADSVTSDEDVRKVTSGVKALLRRLGERIAEKFKEGTPSALCTCGSGATFWWSLPSRFFKSLL